MDFRKSISILMMSGLLFTLASCGNSDGPKKSPQVDSLCAEIDCLSSINWKIQLQGKSFPDKVRVDINGTTVLNECVSKQKYSINRDASPQSLYLDNFYIPKRGELKINLTDMGLDCHSESTFISDDDVDFELTKDLGISEILINL